MIKQLSQIQWKEVPGYNGLYLVSEMGNVFNTKTQKFLSLRRFGPGRVLANVHLSCNGVPTNLSVNKLISQLYGNT